MTGAALLRLSDGGGPAAWRETQRFCGHCAAEPGRDVPRPARVCEECGLGIVLEAAADAAPRPDEPFLVVDSALTVCAVSRRAEELLGVLELEAIHHHVGELLVSAQGDGAAHQLLDALIAGGAGREGGEDIVVRPANTFGIRLRARVAPCGPPSAMLLVLREARSG